MNQAPLKLGVYRHFKGHVVEVLGVARHTEDLDQQLVVYREKETGDLWVRPLVMFLENVEKPEYKGPRFTFISEALAVVPKLHIHYAYPLDKDRRKLFEDKNLGNYPSIDEVKAKVAEWRTLWEKVNHDDRVFKVITDITGIQLNQDLELFVFGAGLNPMSHPLIIPTRSRWGEIDAEEFVNTIIHEIIHRFIGPKKAYPKIADYWEWVKSEYATEPMSTKNHILLYAILEIVLTQIFGPERAASVMVHRNPDYTLAIEIVKEKGAENLVKHFRSFL